MAAHDFHLITHWRVRSSLEEVYGILINPRDYPRWWPEVFLRAQEVRHGDAVGASRTARFNVRGYLPYSLWFQAEVVEARYPFGFTTEVNGDFNGRGIWTFQQAGPWVFASFPSWSSRSSLRTITGSWGAGNNGCKRSCEAARDRRPLSPFFAAVLIHCCQSLHRGIEGALDDQFRRRDPLA